MRGATSVGTDSSLSSLKSQRPAVICKVTETIAGAA